jgi:hypothetical protein
MIMMGSIATEIALVLFYVAVIVVVSVFTVWVWSRWDPQ